MRVAEYGSGVEAGPAGTRPRRFGGFTLTELMAVMLIMMVLVGLVVGVSRWIQREGARRETLSNQTIVKEALLEFREGWGSYPTQLSTFPSTPSGWTADDWQANCRIDDLFKQLSGDKYSTDSEKEKCKKSKEILRKLPVKATNKATISSVVYTRFMDGFAKWMDYSRSGGLGNTPVIISAGPDRDFTTPSDNVRSDEGY